MVCIYCGSATQVANSRLQRRNNQVWRRRQCVACQAVFTTHETVELGGSVMVRSRGQKLLPFSRDSLFVSIYESCKHRPAALPNAHHLTETIIGLLKDHITEGVLDRDILVTVAATALERFDPAAGTMYRAYHPVSR